MKFSRGQRVLFRRPGSGGHMIRETGIIRAIGKLAADVEVDGEARTRRIKLAEIGRADHLNSPLAGKAVAFRFGAHAPVRFGRIVRRSLHGPGFFVMALYQTDDRPPAAVDVLIYGDMIEGVEE